MPPTTTLPTNPPLSANIFRPNQKPRALAVVSPPYPPLGGTHNDAVVQSVARGIRDTQAALVIAFSFPRPTSWTGKKEVEALNIVAKYGLDLLRQEGLETPELILVGYSYGALVTMRFNEDDFHVPLRRALISPPLGAVGFGLMLKAVPSRLDGKGVVVWGDADNWTSKEAYKSWAENLGEDWTGVEVQGSHFFDRGTERLVAAINRWLSDGIAQA